jgi:4-hydroxy-tetrahydrodipicolinate reductase
MTYRVIQWATGMLGVEAVAGIVGHPDLDLVGCWVHSQAKEGRDAGELAGLAPVGIKATRDKDALLAMPADCVCYMAGREWVENPDATLGELARILRSGKNVVNATWAGLVNPAGLDVEVYRTIQDACLEGGTSFYTGGIDPGYGTGTLGLTTLNIAREVRHIHITEILNQAKWSHPDFFKYFGFGGPDTSNIPLLQPGQTTWHHKSTLHLLAEAMGANIEEIVENHRAIFADETFKIAEGVIPKGSVSGFAYQVVGLLGGEPLVTVEHVIRLRDEDFPELGFPGDGYRVEVFGDPTLRLEFTFNSETGNALHGFYISCAMAAVNAIPGVCDAPPGVLTARDLKPYPTKNVVRAKR